jgi:hypothetical protein
MDFEKTRERHPRGVREMRPQPSLDLRQIRLADADLVRERLLGHLAVEAAEAPFDGSEEAELFAECHITNRNIQIAIRNTICQGTKGRKFLL